MSLISGIIKQSPASLYVGVAGLLVSYGVAHAHGASDTVLVVLGSSIAVLVGIPVIVETVVYSLYGECAMDRENDA